MASPRSKIRRARRSPNSQAGRLRYDNAQLDDVLNHQLDPLMEKFRETDPTFYNEYQSARAIVDLNAGRGAQAEPVANATAVSLPKAA